MHFETKAIHAGMQIDEATGAVAPPLHLSTTFQRSEEGEASRGYSYVRDGNPTQDLLEEALAAIDGGAAALAFGSGMAAGTALLQTLPRGSHVVMPDDCYYGYRALADEQFERWGIAFDVVAMEDLDAVRNAMREETRVIWAESPSNPLMKVVDLRALAAMAKERGAIFVVDGTFATPALQRPIELGADVVLHSTTKYLGGHTDVQGGALVFRERNAPFEDTLHVRKITGGVESLIEHRNSSEGAGSRTAENLLRVSVGLEHADDLIADLAQALVSS